MNRLCTVCARGGSQGVKNKNLAKINGISLIGITLTQARKSKLFRYIAVSSDSDAILEEAKKQGADFAIKRPDALATSTSGKIPAIQHCAQAAESLAKINFDIIVDLDVTAPLRWVEDIIKSVELLETNPGTNNVITGAVARRSPYFNLVEETSEGFVTLAKKPEGARPLRRQDVPSCYDMNASIYAWKRENLFSSSLLEFNQTRIHVMPENRSIDIDSELDLNFVRFIAETERRFQNDW